MPLDSMVVWRLSLEAGIVMCVVVVVAGAGGIGGLEEGLGMEAGSSVLSSMIIENSRRGWTDGVGVGFCAQRRGGQLQCI